ncbi:RNA polymerase sigma factor [Paenibacillus sp. RC67]|uniref:RNA polymerase sigma factor n=1 Tax=Paenibacillus sp. RC67 TaxID=3039392 RepID=UPI0024ADFE63|nr:RNA polymerase sigma factor [Paenibacillus sp. RC67]
MSHRSIKQWEPEGEEELSQKLDEQGDQELVAQAQAGDRDAFGELIRRHRAQVYEYARSITQEPFLAEDVVQDALIRAFLHLGTLVDTRRFLPWLHRIVRNQAYTRLRSHSIAKEQAFSSLAASSGFRGAFGGPLVRSRLHHASPFPVPTPIRAMHEPGGANSAQRIDRYHWRHIELPQPQRAANLRVPLF